MIDERKVSIAQLPSAPRKALAEGRAEGVAFVSRGRARGGCGWTRGGMRVAGRGAEAIGPFDWGFQGFETDMGRKTKAENLKRRF